jgi:hypothetical protein
MTNRNNRRPGERPEFTRLDGVRALRDVLSTYLKPMDLKPGELVQARHNFRHWSGYMPREKAPIMVIEVYPDLGAVTGEDMDKGVPGAKIAYAQSDEAIRFELEQAWRFEPYDGPVPDAH